MDNGAVTRPRSLLRRRRRRSAASSDDESEEKDLPVKIQALDCPNEDEAIIDKAATLRCAVAPSLPVAKVFLMYQEPGKEEYSELEMTKSPKGWFVGKIPKKAVTGKSVKYYFEGRNAAGKPVVRNGELSSPNFLLLMEEDAYNEMKDKKGGGGGAGGDERRTPSTSRKVRGSGRRWASATRSWKGSTSGSASASGGSVSAPAAASASRKATGSRR